MAIYTIYQAINSVNCKSYIGHDSNWPKRRREHYNSFNTNKCPKFYKAIRKYGWDAFNWIVLFQSETPLFDLEETFIQLHNSRTKGYNVSVGGHGGSFNRTKQTREKISAAQKGNTYRLGKPHDMETIEKIRLKATNRTPSQEARLKMSLAHKGKIPWNKGKKFGADGENRTRT